LAIIRVKIAKFLAKAFQISKHPFQHLGKAVVVLRPKLLVKLERVLTQQPVLLVQPRVNLMKRLTPKITDRT
jgi:hypothetical protein